MSKNERIIISIGSWTTITYWQLLIYLGLWTHIRRTSHGHGICWPSSNKSILFTELFPMSGHCVRHNVQRHMATFSRNYQRAIPTAEDDDRFRLIFFISGIPWAHAFFDYREYYITHDFCIILFFAVILGMPFDNINNVVDHSSLELNIQCWPKIIHCKCAELIYNNFKQRRLTQCHNIAVHWTFYMTTVSQIIVRKTPSNPASNPPIGYQMITNI